MLSSRPREETSKSRSLIYIFKVVVHYTGTYILVLPTSIEAQIRKLHVQTSHSFVEMSKH